MKTDNNAREKAEEGIILSMTTLATTTTTVRYVLLYVGALSAIVLRKTPPKRWTQVLLL